MTTKQPETYAEFEAIGMAEVDKFIASYPEQKEGRQHHVAVTRASVAFNYAMLHFMLATGSFSLQEMREIASGTINNIIRMVGDNCPKNDAAIRSLVLGEILGSTAREITLIVNTGQGSQSYTSETHNLTTEGTGRA